MYRANNLIFRLLLLISSIYEHTTDVAEFSWILYRQAIVITAAEKLVLTGVADQPDQGNHGRRPQLVDSKHTGNFHPTTRKQGIMLIIYTGYELCYTGWRSEACACMQVLRFTAQLHVNTSPHQGIRTLTSACTGHRKAPWQQR